MGECRCDLVMHVWACKCVCVGGVDGCMCVSLLFVVD